MTYLLPEGSKHQLNTIRLLIWEKIVSASINRQLRIRDSFLMGRLASRVCLLAPDFHGSVGDSEVEKRCWPHRINFLLRTRTNVTSIHRSFIREFFTECA